VPSRGIAALTLAAILPAGPAPADVADMGALVGTWTIAVHDGSARGDHGTITISRSGDGLVGDMTFTDASAQVQSTQVCQVWPGDPTISIWCTVLTPDPGGYAPDNLSVRLVSSDRMEGVMISLTSGRATLTRGETPTS
jgi:hypothetical protein